MAKKRKAAARRRATRKPATRRRRANNPDTTINALVILVVIVMVLGGLYLYVQNKKQAALLPTWGHADRNSRRTRAGAPVRGDHTDAARDLIAQAPQLTAQVLEPAPGADVPRPVAVAGSLSKAAHTDRARPPGASRLDTKDTQQGARNRALCVRAFHIP